MILWGLGWPLGVTAWLGWGWALWQLIRRNRLEHALIVVWTGAYFLWQAINPVPAMRYQIPVYPTLAITAAWGLWQAHAFAGTIDDDEKDTIARIFRNPMVSTRRFFSGSM